MFNDMYVQFISALKHTFPEFADKINTHSYNDFIAIWSNKKDIISARDSSIFTNGLIEIVPGLPMNATLWNELSENTQSVIWKYISALIVLASKKDDSSDVMQSIIEKLLAQMKEDGDDSSVDFGKFSDMIKHFTDMMKSFTESTGTTETFEDFVSKFKIPDKILNGRIAKLVKEILSSFSMEEFGLSEEILSNQEKTLEHLKSLLETNPEIIKKATDKLIGTVKAKLESGSIKQEELKEEVQEILAELTANPELKKLLGGFGDILPTILGGMTFDKKEPSDRCKEVRERLKKKAAAKNAAKSSAIVVAPSAIAEARAAAAMAALLSEEPIVTKKINKR